MYDDLARSQRRGVLELLVMNALIPSLLLTLALSGRDSPGCERPLPHEVPDRGLLMPLTEHLFGGPIPDAFPVLIRMPHPLYPRNLRALRLADRVVLRALVDAHGHVDASSIFAVHAINPAFIAAAEQALRGALFRPARFGGHAGAAWITIGIDFTLTREAT